MLRQAQTIFAKYRGRAFSAVASHPLSMSVKESWKEHRFGIYGAFAGGYVVHVVRCIYKRREHWYKVDGMLQDYNKRLEKHYRALRQLENDGKP
ncbi:unnamed protein product [Microthlaspi erraticum]|uniref:Uncharacterized protein n=1 Tax=Microthlaspi erraticum TaxID=1685480 RepID=A0A6D2KAE4_9BRAS|nr:unnamed protein product [Microthlaspi erraticum]